MEPEDVQGKESEGRRRLARQVSRFKRSLERRELAPAAVNRGAARYMNNVRHVQGAGEIANRVANETPGFPFIDRTHLANFARELVGIAGRVGPAGLVRAFVEAAGRRTAQGIRRDALVEVAAGVYELVTGGTDPSQDRRLRQELAAAEAEIDPKEGQMSSSTKKRESARPAVNGLVMLHHGPLDTMKDEPHAAELMAEKQAVKKLRSAIVPFRPVERQCIIARLARRMSLAAIAATLGITLDDVRDILGRARVRVRRYTTYFDNPWYWAES